MHVSLKQLSGIFVNMHNTCIHIRIQKRKLVSLSTMVDVDLEKSLTSDCIVRSFALFQWNLLARRRTVRPVHLASDLVLTYIHGGGDERAGGGVFEPGTRGIVEGQADPFTEYLETRDPSIRDPASLATPSPSSSSSSSGFILSFFSPLRPRN